MKSTLTLDSSSVWLLCNSVFARSQASLPARKMINRVIELMKNYVPTSLQLCWTWWPPDKIACRLKSLMNVKHIKRECTVLSWWMQVVADSPTWIIMSTPSNMLRVHAPYSTLEFHFQLLYSMATVILNFVCIGRNLEFDPWYKNAQNVISGVFP